MKVLLIAILTFFAGWGSGLGGKIGLDLSMRLNARSYELGCLIVAKDAEYCNEISEIYYHALIQQH